MLTVAGDDPRPCWKAVFRHTNAAHRSGTITSPFVKELVALLGIRWDDTLDLIPDPIDFAIQSGRSAPLALADLVSSITTPCPDAEILALGLAEVVLAQKLRWPKPVPLLLPERYGPAFRTIGGRGRVRTGEPAYPKAICLALVDGIEAALRSATDIDLRASRLLAVVPKLRTEGAELVIRKQLTEDAVLALAPGSCLSRWAATRLFEHLESFEAVRELSGRSSFLLWVMTMVGSIAVRSKRRLDKGERGERLYDRELEDLPPDLRRREWMLRVEAVIFVSAEAVPGETLARVVGKDCSIDLLIEDIVEELRDRPYDLLSVAGGWQHRTRPRFGETIRASTAPTRGGAAPLSKLEAMVLMAVGCFQPVTRGELGKIFCMETLHDLPSSIRNTAASWR